MFHRNHTLLCLWSLQLPRVTQAGPTGKILVASMSKESQLSREGSTHSLDAALGSVVHLLLFHLELSHNSPTAMKISFTWWLDFADVSTKNRPLVLANSSPS